MCTFAVRSNLYHLLGRFAAVYPEHMVKYSDKLLEFYVGVLKAEVTLLMFLSIIWLDYNCVKIGSFLLQNCHYMNA